MNLCKPCWRISIISYGIGHWSPEQDCDAVRTNHNKAAVNQSANHSITLYACHWHHCSANPVVGVHPKMRLLSECMCTLNLRYATTLWHPCICCGGS